MLRLKARLTPAMFLTELGLGPQRWCREVSYLSLESRLKPSIVHCDTAGKRQEPNAAHGLRLSERLLIKVGSLDDLVFY